MRRVLVTHVDSPLGRRLVSALYHDPEVSLVFGTGRGPQPSFLEAYQDKCVYQRLDLARARHLTSFFGSERFARAHCDSLIHLPFVRPDDEQRIPGNVPSLVSETRRLFEAGKRHRALERIVYLSSAFVYRAEPGNSNLLTEEDLLDFESDADPEVRSWVDADLVCQKELNDPRLRMTILRAATIVTEGGRFLNSPPLARGEPPFGFDPMVSVVTDRDVVRAILLALHGDRPGIYNVAGNEIFPWSALRPSTSSLPGLRALVGGGVSLLRQTLGLGARAEPEYRRYGIVLDRRLAAEALGFQPQYRIEIRRRGRGRTIDVVRCR